jgi:flagellar biosynthesis protein FliR
MTVSLPLGESLGFLPKMLLAAGMSVALTPLVPIPDQLTVWIMLAEFVLGLLVGAPFRVLVDLSEAFGELIDTSRGQTIAAVNDPLNQHAVSDLATLCKIAATTVAINLGALEVCVESLAESYRSVPVGAMADFQVISRELLAGGLRLVGSMLVACAVWLVSFLVIDCAACFAARVAKALSFTAFGSLLKMVVTGILLGVLVVSSDRGGGVWLADRLRAFLGYGVEWVSAQP